MQGEWDIEMANDDDEVSLVHDNETPSGHSEGATIQDILSGGRNRLPIVLGSHFDSAFHNAISRQSPS